MYLIIGERDILSFLVKCTHCEQGCTWTGELRKFEEHVKKCSADVISCPYLSVGCKAKIFKKNLEEHKVGSTSDHLALAMEKIKLLDECLKAKAEKNVPPDVIFKMEEFGLYKDNELEWDSPPFYTHEKGYKLYVKVSPRTNTFSDIDYVSVCVCLMHGEYDEDLIWPFRGTIDFELLNQNEDCDHKTGTARFMERYSSRKNTKVPADEGRRSIGWGVDNIIELEDEDDLGDDWYDHHQSDDTLYVCISSVSISDLNKPWLIQ